MARGRTHRATVGVAEHSNTAVLVTVAPGGEFLDRRRIDLTDRDLPTHPHHHEGSWAVGRYLNTPGARALSLADAVALVERAIDLVVSKRDDGGKWPLDTLYPGRMLVEMDEGEGRPSRWNTLRALRVLDWYSSRD